ncbi:LUD domain-containing protein [Chryseobacterium sp.]|uniref:LutC/YkgG family protein n=1 Tax=Chryseobacterium sp. TaxID=1871047 RepID=UPI0025C138EB|nr:LUD domain-containing protein [Chryseobacterium sp.]
MGSKEDILKSVRKSLEKREKVAYPVIPDFQKQGIDLKSLFEQNLKLAGVDFYDISSIEEAQKIMGDKLPDTNVICSSTDEWKGNKDINSIEHPKDLNDVDLGIFRAEFGVAEMGMVWVTEKSLQVNAIGFLSQHVAVLLDPAEITENMHTAYQREGLLDVNYGCFVMGPSATADIGAYLVRGAQGARSLTLFFLEK